MSKITRVNGNVRAFGSAQASGERTLFGQTTVSDDLTAQFTAQFLRGWGIVSASEFPKLQDFNAATFTNGQLLAYLHQMGIPEYNAAQEFYLNSVTQFGGALYMSIQDGNTGRQPNTNPAWWKPLLVQATELVAGIMKIATTTLALAGVDDTTSMTPLKVKQAMDQKLPFVPVQQGGGVGQGLNKLNVGWDALARLRLSVDGLNKGAFVLDSNLTAFLPKRSFTTADYIRIPDVPGGLIIQWTEGVSVALSPGAITSQSVSLPITFPTSVLKTFVTTKYISGVTTVASEAPTGGTESSVSVVMHNPVPTGTGTGRPVVLSFGY